MSRASGRPGHSELRIIGGQWRGRKLRFAPEEGLRPTTDRVRETLFNWLTPEVHGARCLDLFAGSGALGLEALSRGAAHCDFVDTSPRVIRQLRQHLDTLGAGAAGCCHQRPALDYLAGQSDAAQPWDIVFVDPPFGHALAGPSCAQLDARGLLAPDALVYLETGAGEPLPELPAGWDCHREKRAGGVAYRLFVVTPG
ncbi:16S rRNA (guanine(966)-N(2))-methyltransferase RsmD [Mangrovimicrobium sediminis]|uniref:Ribosomal RNA small subunit methyltransferase D n=1 Tax=Mangrovimicrobium sediminis TaxID=2562682 RepID=A0A4Z0M040_9GAMM|nr:16S rRNA (guanine(966)-N(2))-methyltransferase RsmD [Haliea sp. SAOS-164]TGD72738.1 16S rRNA (guanine(966)-N(2))-methyltransferase RsmD [Haliea sp. SAOS-164]